MIQENYKNKIMVEGGGQGGRGKTGGRGEREGGS